MRKIRIGCCALAAVAVALAAGPALAGVGDLQYVKPPPNLPMGIPLLTLAKAAVPAKHGLISPNARLVPTVPGISVAFDASTAGSKRLDVIRIDPTGKNNFANALKLKLPDHPGTGSAIGRLGPTPAEVTREGRKIPVLVSAFFLQHPKQFMGCVSLTVAAEGTCAFGQTTRKVRVIGRNGAVGLAAAGSSPARGREVDEIEEADAQGNFPRRRAATPLNQPLQVDGKWYTAKVTGMKVSASLMAGETGKLSVGAARWTCTLTGKTATLAVTGGAEPVEVPVGSYKVRDYQFFSEADPGKFVPVIRGRGAKTLDIAAGTVAALKIGPPLQANISIRQKAGKVTFSLAMTDAAGGAVFAISVANGSSPPPPTIDVVDAGGKRVYTAKLEYG